MKRAKTIIFMAAFLAFVCPLVHGAGSVPQKVLDAALSTVSITAESTEYISSGSGFIIYSESDATYVATNFHVVEHDPYKISVWISSDETVSESIYASLKQKDMCILKLAYPLNLSALPFDKDGANQGDAVYAIGYPAAADILSDTDAHVASEATITDGIVSALRSTTISNYGTPVEMYQINVAINSGNSGGPLLNENGEVVGINTFGITDAQGIFGAISVSELKSFMADKGLLISNGSGHISIALIVAGGAFVFLLIVVIALFARRNKRKKQVDEKMNTDEKAGISQALSLRELMASFPAGLSTEDAVAVLMPVLRQLRELHDNGTAHLEISPATIAIQNSSVVLQPCTNVVTARYSSGYTAPEIYRGKNFGPATDIYSLCAVLAFLTSGTDPANALERSENLQPYGEAESDFTTIYAKGMALESAQRYQNVQDLIYALIPYNTGKPIEEIFPSQVKADIVPATAESSPAKSKKKGKPVIITVVAIVFVLLLAGGTYIGTYFLAISAAEDNNFSKADNLLICKQLTQLHDPLFQSYVNAGRSFENRKYDEAVETFQALQNYRSSADLLLETYYRQAAQKADALDFVSAENIYRRLSNEDYKDSSQLLLDTRYREAMYLLYEKEDFAGAYTQFKYLAQGGYSKAEEMLKETHYLWGISLADNGSYRGAYNEFSEIPGYKDANDFLSAVCEVLYAEAQVSYAKGDYSKAEDTFQFLSPFSDSDNYLTLIEARDFTGIILPSQARPHKYSSGEELVIQLKKLFYFEDAADILIQNSYLAKIFLKGSWYSSDGYYYFTLDYSSVLGETHTSYNMPWYDGDFYYLENGIYMTYYDGNKAAAKKQYGFYPLTPDSMEVYCFKDGSRYTLYRQ